ncbi:ribbon-helix-helix domain-containing protein [Candidatus Methanomassiliicoccus intestinalis]|uniref:ribbon-helix-helix domain-containing protein n=1 Tax=Candidatus Methanomassiliicoccus intestinalis TaxID=1406512 RepID=UPI0037DD2D94
MDGERISLRLESEDLELLDEFIESHPEYSNRSNLARVAIREFVENSGLSKRNTRSAGDYEVTVELPKALYNILSNMVDAGYFRSMGEILVDCARDEYLNKKAMKEKVMTSQERDVPFEVIER